MIVKIHVKVMEVDDYACRILQTDIPCGAVILLGRVRKSLLIERVDAIRLRRKKLIEGRYPNHYVAAHVASAADQRAQYIKNRAFDDDHYKRMILEYLKQYGHASRGDIEALLLDKLSDVLNEVQKRYKVKNLLHAMAKRDGTIRSTGSGSHSRWELSLDKKSAE